MREETFTHKKKLVVLGDVVGCCIKYKFFFGSLYTFAIKRETEKETIFQPKKALFYSPKTLFLGTQNFVYLN